MIDQGNLIDSPAGYSKSDYDRSWKSEVTAHDRSGKPDKTSWNAAQQICPHHGNALLDGNAHSVRYGERIHDGSGQLDCANYQEEADSETFVMGSDAAEFVNKVKDQVRKRQKRMSNVADSGEEHSIIWRMFMAATMNAATFMGKNFMDNENSIKNSTDLTLKKMFDISEKSVSEQEEINNVDQIYWKNHSWKQLSLIGDETVINLQLLVQVPRRSGILWKRTAHKEFGIISRTRCCWNSQKSGCPIFRATTPLSTDNLKSKGHGKLSIHFAADYPTIETSFRIIVFANQLSHYGAVANMCEEFESHQDRSGQLDVLMGQTIVLSGIKAEVPLENDIPSHQNLLLQRYEERIKLLSQENKVSKFCMDAGFTHVVEIGQYFMTKDTEEQFFAKACREYTLPRSDESSQPKGWIQGRTRIGPVLEITTSYLHCKHGVEIRIWSLSEDNTQSWVRISHGPNKFVIDSNCNNTEVPADLPEEQASQPIVKVFAARSKAKAKPQRREPVDVPSIIPMNERKWIDIEPGESSFSAYERFRRK